MKKGNARRSAKSPSKRSLQRAITRVLARRPLADRVMIADAVSWHMVPHKKNEEKRLSIARRAEAVLRSWDR